MRPNTLIACFFLLWACATDTLFAAEFAYGRIDPRNPSSPEAVILRGEIRRGDYERLLSFVRKDPDRFQTSTVILASSGGDLREAIKIADLIKATYQSVVVTFPNGPCASACFLIYVSAVERDATLQTVGIHRPYFGPEYFTGLTLAEAEARHKALLKETRSYLEAREVPQYLIERMFSLASNEVYWLKREDLARVGPRSNWYDQLLVDRCRLNKQLEQEFDNRGRLTEDALAHFTQVARCAYDITHTEGASNLRKKLERPQ